MECVIEAYRWLFLALSVLTMLTGLERLCHRTCRFRTDAMGGGKQSRRMFRRFQLGVLLLLEGVFLFLGSLVCLETHPIFFMVIWLLAIVFLFWLVLHCFLDLARTSSLVERYREELLDEELRMIASLYRRSDDFGSDVERSE